METKYRYHLSGYFTDFVEASNLGEARDLFSEMFFNAKRSEIIWEVHGVEGIKNEPAL